MSSSSERIIITLKDIDWEYVVNTVKLEAPVKQKRKLKINSIPDNVFSYKDSRLAEHRLLFTAYDMKTGKSLSPLNHKCWHCDVELSEQLVGGVIKKKGTIYYTDGYFCDWACMKKGVRSMPQVSVPLCAELYYNLTGNQWSSLKEAPDWTLLSQYGGTMEYEDWQNLKGSKDIVAVKIQGLQISPVARLWEEMK